MMWCIGAKWTTGTSDLLSLQLAERPDNTTLLHSKRQYRDQTALMARTREVHLESLCYFNGIIREGNPLWKVF